MEQALLHPGPARSSLPQRDCFCSPTVASFEAQFSAQSCVGVHDDTEAHAHPSHLSLNSPASHNMPRVYAQTTPAFLRGAGHHPP